jgi:hypothetical protein
MDDTDRERHQREVRAILLSVAIIGFVGFGGALTTAAVINLRGDHRETRTPPPPSQPTTGQGQASEQPPEKAPSK